MNPDINDAAWIKQRGKLWDSVSKKFKKAFTKRDLTVLKAWFMGEPYEHGNTKLYGESLAHAWALAWILSPFQNRETWRRLITADLKSWQNVKDPIQLGLARLSCLYAENNTNYGWDFATHLEVSKYTLGDRFANGDYVFEGIPCRYAFSVQDFHFAWIVGALQWLGGAEVDDETVVTHFFLHWQEAMRLSHTAYFNKKVSRRVSGAQNEIHNMMRRAFDYEADVGYAAETGKLSKAGIENRLAFGKALKDYFESPKQPIYIQNLYDFVTDKAYERPFPYDFMPEEDDISLSEVEAGG